MQIRVGSELADQFSCNIHVAILATIYRSAEAPARQKCRKSASESAGPKRGAEESAEKVLPHRASVEVAINLEAPSNCTFLGTPFGAGTFRSIFLALLSGQRFGTSVDGREDCNINGQEQNM